MGIGGKGVTTVPPTTTVGGPSVVRTFPAITHRFAARPYLPSGITPTRDSTVNGWTAGPVLTEFAIDEPAFVIDPATGQALGYRALAGFTNSLLWSRDLSNAVWNKAGGLTVSQDSVGLDGSANTAWTVTDADNTAVSTLSGNEITVADDTNTHVFVVNYKKQSASNYPRFNVQLKGGTTELSQDVVLDLENGTVSATRSGDGSTKIRDLGDFWQIKTTITNNGTGNTTLAQTQQPALNTDGTAGTVDSAATGSIVYDFGGVYLNSSIAGPPIETEGSPVSTAADDATESVPTSLQSAGTLLISARTANGLSGDQVLAQMDDGTENNRVRLVRNSSREVRYIVTDGGSEVANLNLGTVADDTDTKVAIRYGDDDYAGIISGGMLQTDTTGTMPAISTLRHGRDTADGEEWNGTIAGVRGDDAYTDSQLEGAL